MHSTKQTVTDIIKIGKNPKLREGLIKKYDGANVLGIKTGEQDMKRNGDDFGIKKLKIREKLAFLHGARLLLESHVTESDCGCHMPPAITLPVAAFTALLREDEATAKSAWRHFKKIRRHCAERNFGRKNLATLKFSEFVDQLIGQNKNASAAERRNLAAIRLEEEYKLKRA